MSVIAAPALGGDARASTCFARCDCGLFVGLPSVVNAPPQRLPIATAATPTATSHAATTRHGCRALSRASACVECLIPSLERGSTRPPHCATAVDPHALLLQRMPPCAPGSHPQHRRSGHRSLCGHGRITV